MVCRGDLKVGVRIAIEDTAIVRRRTKTTNDVSQTSALRLDKRGVILPIVTVAPAELKIPRPVEEAHSCVFARMPAVRVFGLRACADGHRKSAQGVEFETWVGVFDVKFDGGANWSGGLGVVDDYSGDVPRGILDEGIALLVLRL